MCVATKYGLRSAGFIGAGREVADYNEICHFALNSITAV